MTRFLPILLLAACATVDEPVATKTTCSLLCASTAQVQAGLAAMGQEPLWRGVSGRGALLERYEDKDGWSLVLTTPDGQSCLLSEGTASEQLFISGRAL